MGIIYLLDQIVILVLLQPHSVNVLRVNALVIYFTERIIILNLAVMPQIRSKSLPPKPTMKSSKPCFHFHVRGGCKLGSFCRFRHAVRYVPKVLHADPPPNITFEEAMEAAKRSFVACSMPISAWKRRPIFGPVEKLEEIRVELRKEERERIKKGLRQETL
jgi:hypothetical protein